MVGNSSMDFEINNIKHTVGRKNEEQITLDARESALVKACSFNEKLHSFFGTKGNGIVKGVYHFKNHQEANLHKENSVATKMSDLALESSNKK